MDDRPSRRRLTETGAERIERLERELAEARASAARAPTPDALLDVAAARKAAEQALVDSERRYRLLVESSADVVFVTDQNRFVYVSPSMKTMLGHDAASLVGQPTAPFVHPEDRSIIQAALARIMSSDTTKARVMFRALHADGSYRTVELTGRNLLHEPTVGGIVANMQDVTERERARTELLRSEAALRENEGVLETAQAVGHVGSYRWTAGERGGSVEWSKETYRIFGDTPETFDGTFEAVCARVHPGDLRALISTFAETRRRGANEHSLEHRIVRPDGSVRWIHTAGVASRDAHGRVTQVIGHVHDIDARKRAEHELAERERRFRVLVETSTDVVCISNGEVLTYVSPAVEGVLGFTPEELLGTSALELLHPEDFPVGSQLRQQIIADETHAPVRTKLRIRHKDGGYRTAEFFVRYFFDDPAIRGLAVNFHDVTAREAALDELRRSEAILRESREQLEKAQAIAHIGSWVVDLDGEGAVMIASDETLRIFGVGPDEFDGDPFSLEKNLEPSEWEHAGNATLAAIAEGGPFLYDARIRRGSGFAWIHVEGIVEKTDDGTTRIFGTTLDVTDRVRAEEELRASEARYRRIIDTTSEGVWMMDPERRTLFVSGRMAAMLGRTPEQMTGRPFADFLAGPAPAHAAAHHARLLEGAFEHIEYQLRHANGETRWVSMATSRLVDEAGLHEGMLAMVTDITARREADELRERERRRAEQAERSLRETEEQLRQAQKLESLGQLAGGVAHDFNNLLSVILGYTSILMEELPAQDPSHKDVSEIHEAGLRASELTQQLLAFSRKQVLQPRVVDVGSIILRAERMLRRLLGEDVELLLVQASERLAVKADPGQLEQVIVNLAVNARDAMPSGGRLTFETQRAQLREDEARAMGLAPGDYVALTVTDTGVGMDEAVRSRIFEPFFTTKAKGKGTGLGLATVFGIVKQSAGHVLVESKPGGGTSFRVLLPTTEAVVQLAGSAPVETPARNGETILLVEDEDQVRVLARNVLRRGGYRVLDAANGGEALLISEQHEGPIDLLLTDVVMPRMDGHQLAGRLAPLRPAMNVLYMSGYTDDTVLRHGVELGELALLPKPFTPSTLVAKVRAVLDQSTSAGAGAVRTSSDTRDERAVSQNT